MRECSLIEYACIAAVTSAEYHSFGAVRKDFLAAKMAGCDSDDLSTRISNILQCLPLKFFSISIESVPSGFAVAIENNDLFMTLV